MDQPSPQTAAVQPVPETNSQLLETLCPRCHSKTAITNYFCPNCGYKLKIPPPSLGKQIGLYLLSFFLPPFGLWPAIKLILRPDSVSKRTGWIAIFLTVISIIISIWLAAGIINTFQKTLNSQLNMYNINSYQ